MKPHFPKGKFGARLTSGLLIPGRSLIWRQRTPQMPPTNVNRASGGGFAAMAGTRLERLWKWLHEVFPERQVYIRSDGRVQFFTFGATLQATLAGLTLIFLGWVAFATVNVIFKDRIIT